MQRAKPVRERWLIGGLNLFRGTFNAKTQRRKDAETQKSEDLRVMRRDWRKSGLLVARRRAPALALLLFVSAGLAAEVDVSRLPPPAQQTVDFTKDIKPILQNHCFKCHAGEKPKSHFLLTTRETALKGGDHGVDIVPGQSAKSPLIHYVAGLDEEMQMPPEGRGTPLTPEQVGLLRAWIDQGAAWEPTEQPPPLQWTLDPAFQWTSVSGDKQKFRELYWQREEWRWGLEDFEMVQQLGPDSKITAAGHAMLDDYKLTLDAQKNDLGFTRFGWSRFRKYYDDTGGYQPLFSPPSFNLNEDLHVDVGRAWADFGLTLPNWPRIVVGYEYQYRDGTESTLQWGPVMQGTNISNIYPGFKQLSEKTHILKLDVDYELAGVVLSDSFRGEWYTLQTQELNGDLSTNGAPPLAFTSASENQKYFQGANTFHLEKQFLAWLFAAGGYLYSKLDADGSLNVEPINAAALVPPVQVPPVRSWNVDGIELERESHVFSLNTLLGPWESLSLSLGVQNEWTREMGMGNGTNFQALPFPPYGFAGSLESVSSDMDRRIFSQEAGLRFTKIPFTTLFAEAEFRQDNVGQFEEEMGGQAAYLTQTDASSKLQDFRLGFNTSPWRRVSLSAQYRRSDDETDYNIPTKLISGTTNTFQGYPGFIQWRDLASDQAEVKLALQLNAWLKTSLSYQWLANDYHTATDPVTNAPNVSNGGALLAGTYDAQIASLNATLTPWRRLFLSTTFSYQNSRTVTWANNSSTVVPYAGNTYSAIISGNYALNDKTSLVASYSFSTADFSQDTPVGGLPLGIHYYQHTLEAGVKRQIAKATSLGLQYRFYLYNEPSSGGLNNFVANGVYATLACRLP
jgi:hypothetical protein